MSMIVQLLHPGRTLAELSCQPQPEEYDVFELACRALRNMVTAAGQQRDREARILKPLEQVRAVSMHLRFVRSGLQDLVDSVLETDALPAMQALMRFSFDEENRYATGQLGGLQAIADLLIADRLTFQNSQDVKQQSVHSLVNSRVTLPSPPCMVEVRRLIGMSLTNLTFGDGHNKAVLCAMPVFLNAVSAQLLVPSEEVRQVFANALRNLSWKADGASKSALRESGVVSVLLRSAMDPSLGSEKTLKGLLSALWNLSSHSSENKELICRTPGALEFLASTLAYRSGANNHAIAENGGGILRNISSIVGVHEEQRAVLRGLGTLQALLDNLRSPSLTVVSNACGTLWNLSARNPEDQALLWTLGAVPMLQSLSASKHRMISMGSRGALRNLLATQTCRSARTASPSLALLSDDLARLKVAGDPAANRNDLAEAPDQPWSGSVMSDSLRKALNFPHSHSSGGSAQMRSSASTHSDASTGRRGTAGNFILQNLMKEVVGVVDSKAIPRKTERASSQPPAQKALSREEQIRLDRATVQRLHNGLKKRQPELLANRPQLTSSAGNLDHGDSGAVAMDDNPEEPLSSGINTGGTPSECGTGPRNFASSGKCTGSSSIDGSSRDAQRGLPPVFGASAFPEPPKLFGAPFGPPPPVSADAFLPPPHNPLPGKNPEMSDMPRIFAIEGGQTPNSNMSKWSSLSSLMRDAEEGPRGDQHLGARTEPGPEVSGGGGQNWSRKEEQMVDEPVPLDRFHREQEQQPRVPSNCKIMAPVGTSVNATPDLGSRRSSMSSLGEDFDVKSTVDSLYSQQPTGYCSPSDLPESPSRTMPPSPRARRHFYNQPDSDAPRVFADEGGLNEDDEDERPINFAAGEKAQPDSSRFAADTQSNSKLSSQTKSSESYWSSLKGSNVPIAVATPMQQQQIHCTPAEPEDSDSEEDPPAEADDDPQDASPTSADVTFTFASDRLEPVSERTEDSSLPSSGKLGPTTNPTKQDILNDFIKSAQPLKGKLPGSAKTSPKGKKGAPGKTGPDHSPPKVDAKTGEGMGLLADFITNVQLSAVQRAAPPQRSGRIRKQAPGHPKHTPLPKTPMSTSHPAPAPASADQLTSSQTAPPGTLLGCQVGSAQAPETSSVPNDLHLNSSSKAPRPMDRPKTALQDCQRTNAPLAASNASSGILEASGISLMNSLDFGLAASPKLGNSPMRVPMYQHNVTSSVTLDDIEPPDDLMAFSGSSAFLQNATGTMERVKDASALLSLRKQYLVSKTSGPSPTHAPGPGSREQQQSGLLAARQDTSGSLSEDNYSLGDELSPDCLALDPGFPESGYGEDVVAIPHDQLADIVGTEELLIDCDSLSIASSNLLSLDTASPDNPVSKVTSDPSDDAKVVSARKKPAPAGQKAGLSHAMASPRVAVRTTRTTELRARRNSGNLSGSEAGSTGRLNVTAESEGHTRSRTASPNASPRSEPDRPSPNAANRSTPSVKHNNTPNSNHVSPRSGSGAPDSGKSRPSARVSGASRPSPPARKSAKDPPVPPLVPPKPGRPKAVTTREKSPAQPPVDPANRRSLGRNVSSKIAELSSKKDPQSQTTTPGQKTARAPSSERTSLLPPKTPSKLSPKPRLEAPKSPRPAGSLLRPPSSRSPQGSSSEQSTPSKSPQQCMRPTGNSGATKKKLLITAV